MFKKIIIKCHLYRALNILTDIYFCIYHQYPAIIYLVISIYLVIISYLPCDGQERCNFAAVTNIPHILKTTTVYFFLISLAWWSRGGLYWVRDSQRLWLWNQLHTMEHKAFVVSPVRGKKRCVVLCFFLFYCHRPEMTPFTCTYFLFVNIFHSALCNCNRNRKELREQIEYLVSIPLSAICPPPHQISFVFLLLTSPPGKNPNVLSLYQVQRSGYLRGGY